MKNTQTHAKKQDIAKQRHRKRLKSKVNKIIRRVHMYLGLVLVPWVILYGSTAILFNHGSWFTQRDYLSLVPNELEQFPSADQMAQQAMQKISHQHLTLVPQSAEWIGPLSFRGTLEGKRVSCMLATCNLISLYM